MDTKFYVGQRVKCPNFGKGEVTLIIETSTFPVCVRFDSGIKKHYMIEGNLYPNFRPTLEPDEPHSVDITPEWDKVDNGFIYVAIDESGTEYAYAQKPFASGSHWRTWDHWNKTGRTFDMANIDWTKTLSKRPQ